ncbi:hypothetical protein [Pseudomonas sp. NPDC089401]|uniref:hypothetical protein n=1 Tax=Pseudomonas sp. NPDC089401 TaxID=3364462 RepID=UPI00382B7086
MAFSDLLSAENVGNLMQDPRMMLGLQLMAQGRQGSSSQALGQAGSQAAVLLQEQRRAQELAQYRQQMTALQQQQQAMAMQAAQAKQEAQQRQQAAFADPSVQAQLGPLARTLAAQGLDPEAVLRANANDALRAHRAATLQQQQSQFDTRQAHQGGGQSSEPRTPAPRPYIDQPIGNNQMQRYKFDPSINDYAPWGEPFSQYSPGRKAKPKSGADGMVDAILNGTEPGDKAVPDASSLPGTGSLQSYAPQPQAPVGVLPMAAAGGGAAKKPAPKAGTRVPGQAQIARPLTRADYDALPAGAPYVDPVSGKTATKRG